MVRIKGAHEKLVENLTSKLPVVEELVVSIGLYVNLNVNLKVLIISRTQCHKLKLKHDINITTKLISTAMITTVGFLR